MSVCVDDVACFAMQDGAGSDFGHGRRNIQHQGKPQASCSYHTQWRNWKFCVECHCFVKNSRHKINKLMGNNFGTHIIE